MGWGTFSIIVFIRDFIRDWKKMWNNQKQKLSQIELIKKKIAVFENPTAE